MQNKIKKIILVCGMSRFLLIIEQCIANAVIPDHDANVFLYPRQNLTETVLDKAVQFLLGGFVRWDAQYFMHIARYGYTYENTLAFFPLYPILVKGITMILSPFVIILNEESLLLLVFIILNCYVFVKTALVLFELSYLVLQDHDLAYKSVVLFCINPATIFFIAPYSECLFSYLTFKGMLNCVLMYYNATNLRLKFESMIPIALSTCVRSNGILNLGFLAYFNIKAWMKNKQILKITECLILMLCLVPFLMVQVYDYLKFCTNFDHNLDDFLVSFAKSNDFVLPGSVVEHKQKWCFDKIPLAYSYIQDHYWNVGFLRYFEIKQIPNFLLALPIVALLGVSTVSFVKEHFSYCLTLGLYHRKSGNGKGYCYERNMFVFVTHAAALTIFCMFCIHVQVSTRMICSASPVIYWYCAYHFKDVREQDDCFQNIFIFNKNLNNIQKFIKFYFISYCIVGTALFSNFLPWT